MAAYESDASLSVAATLLSGVGGRGRINKKSK